MKNLRTILILVLCMLAAFGFGGNLTVTSPTNNAYVGSNASLTFNISGATLQVTVTAVITYPDNSTNTVTNTFNPDSDGNISGSLPLGFGASSPQGQYSIVVSATEPGNTYSPTTLTVNVITIAPKFEDFTPSDGAYVNGTIHIRASIQSANLKTWQVQVNGQSVPNGSGTGTSVAVDFDTSGIIQDGTQTITITATDQAQNTSTKTLSVTLERIPPIITVTYPTTTTKIVPGSTISILVDIQTENSGAMDKTGVTVLAKRTDGTYITLCTLVSFAPTSSTTNRWTGRIRYVKGLLPSKFELVAAATDRAGNVGAPQQISVTIGR